MASLPSGRLVFLFRSFGQLIREDNKSIDKTLVYEYNGIGNITAVKEYPLTAAGVTPSGTPTTTSYTYDTTQVDRLTNFGGKAITYDALGNVKTYDGWTYTWTRGRLTKMSKGNKTSGTYAYNFTYNGYGQRISKTYSFTPPLIGTVETGTVLSYTQEFSYDNSGRLVYQKKTGTRQGQAGFTEEITFLYDESSIIGMIYFNGASTVTYYFDRNIRGDVIRIYNPGGGVVAKYTYDAYGNCNIASGTTSFAVADANPIRYRGYYYDSDTKLYYLNARYYNPAWRRFISPDDSSYLDPESVNGLNLYAYCYNDPVNYADPSGHSAFLIAMSILAVAGLITTGIGVATDNNLVTAIGLTAVAVPALISGGLAISLLTPVGLGVGITTTVAGTGTALFASAEYQEAFTDNNWMIDAGMSEDVYNTLMLTTAAIATLGTMASSVAYSFNINTITEFGKIKGSNYKGIKFTQIRNGKPIYKSLEFHHGHAHGGHKLHWQLNKWSKTGIKSRGGTAWWTIWLKRIS